MICLRCGHCCKNYFVPVVDDPSKGIELEDNLIMHEGDGTPCKHLWGDKPGEYSCALHSASRYKDTPCFEHTQVEQGNTNCRMGEYLLAKEDNK